MGRTRPPSVYVRIRHRRTSRQDRRSDFRRHPRRDPRAGSGRARRVRNARHDRPGRSSPAKSPRAATSTSRRSSAASSATSATRARKYGFDAETCAVLSAIHEQSRDIGQGVDTGGAGDQGLMFGFACRETRRADAAADHARAQARARAVGSAPRRRARLPPAGRQVAGHRRVRRRHARCASTRSSLSTQHSADGRRRSTITRRPDRAASSSTIIPADDDGQEHEDLRQSDGTLRDRRSARRRRRHRPQDHRRHLRRRGAARRRRVLGQGSDEGRSLGVLHGALHREERRRGRPRRSRDGAARVRDRRRRSGLGARRHVGHRQDRRREDRRARARALQAHAARHHRVARSAPADLPQDRGVRPLRPHRARVHLGADRQGRRAARRTPGSSPARSARASACCARLHRSGDGGPRGRRRACTSSLTLPPARASRSTAPSPARSSSAPITSTRRDRTAAASVDEIAAAAARAGPARSSSSPITATRTRAPDPPSYRHGVLVIDAVEISTDGGHVVALGSARAPRRIRWPASARDVIDDIHRLGGRAVVAHPDSPKPELRWRARTACRTTASSGSTSTPSGATSRRCACSAAALRSLVRPAESIASLLRAADARRCSAGTRRRAARRVVRRRGARRARAHRLAATATSRARRTLLRAAELRGDVPHAGAGRRARRAAVRDAPATTPRSVLGAIVSGRSFSIVRALAGPAVARVRGDAGRRTRAWAATRSSQRDGRTTFRAAVSGGAGRARRPAARTAGRSRRGRQRRTSSRGQTTRARTASRSFCPAAGVPWIVSNPIYVACLRRRADGPPRHPADASRRVAAVPLDAAWTIEKERVVRRHDRALTPAGTRLPLRARPRRAAAASTRRWRHVGRRRQPASIACEFTARADRPMRVSVQLRLPGGGDGAALAPIGLPRRDAAARSSLRVCRTSSRSTTPRPPAPDRRADSRALLVRRRHGQHADRASAGTDRGSPTSRLGTIGCSDRAGNLRPHRQRQVGRRARGTGGWRPRRRARAGSRPACPTARKNVFTSQYATRRGSIARPMP